MPTLRNLHLAELVGGQLILGDFVRESQIELILKQPVRIMVGQDPRSGQVNMQMAPMLPFVNKKVYKDTLQLPFNLTQVIWNVKLNEMFDLVLQTEWEKVYAEAVSTSGLQIIGAR